MCGLPAWATTYDYFRRWRRDGTLRRIHDRLHRRVRKAAILDSQTVETTDQGGIWGYDAAKKVVGRKRYLLVDALGLPLLAVVHVALEQDRTAARRVLSPLAQGFHRLRLVGADGGSRGGLADWLWGLQSRRKVRFELVGRIEEHQFAVLPMWWIARSPG